MSSLWGGTPVPTSAHGMGGEGDQVPKEAVSCRSASSRACLPHTAFAHTGRGLLVLVVTGKVGRAVGWQPV